MWNKAETKVKGTLITTFSYRGSEQVTINKIIIEKVSALHFIYISGPNEQLIYNLIADSKQFYTYTQADHPYPPAIQKNTQLYPGFRISISRFKNKNEADFHILLKVIFSEMQKNDSTLESIIPIIQEELTAKITWINNLSLFSDNKFKLEPNDSIDYRMDEKLEKCGAGATEVTSYILSTSNSSKPLQFILYKKTILFEYDHNFAMDFLSTKHLWKLAFNNPNEATTFFIKLEMRINSYKEKLSLNHYSDMLLKIEDKEIIMFAFPVFVEAFKMLSEQNLCSKDSLISFKKKTELDVCLAGEITNFEREKLEEHQLAGGPVF